MPADTPLTEFYGFLGRFEVTQEMAILRLYPFTFASDQDTPILEITVRHPAFSAADLAPLIGAEIEVTLHADRVQVEDALDGRISLTLMGAEVSAAHKAYDLQDYADRLKSMHEHNAEQAAELHAVLDKLRRVKSVAIELIRRAELKAGVSHEHSLKQAGAIEALQRILAELELED